MNTDATKHLPVQYRELWQRFIVFYWMFCLFLLSCESQTHRPVTALSLKKDVSAQVGAVQGGKALENNDENNTDESQNNNRQSGKDAQHTQKKFVRRATLAIRVEALQQSQIQITTIVRTVGGYIASEQEYTDNTALVHVLEIRVPKQSFDSVLTVLANHAETDSKSVDVEDITEQYVDTEARLKTRRDVEEQYRQLLKKAISVQDVLAVEAQLRLIREEIEAAEGRLYFMAHNVSMSHIHLTLTQKFSAASVTRHFGTKIVESFVIGWEYFLKTVLMLTVALPIAIGLGIPLYALWRFFRRRKTSSANVYLKNIPPDSTANTVLNE